MRRFPLYGPLGKFSWRMLSVVLAGQAVVIFFGALVANGLEQASGQTRGSTLLWVGSGLAVLSLLAAGSMRRPWGVTLGWLVQGLTWVAAVVLPAMIGVGVIFTGLWILLMAQGRRADDIIAARDAADDGPTG